MLVPHEQQHGVFGWISLGDIRLHDPSKPKPPVPRGRRAETMSLRDALESGQFVVTAEVPYPLLRARFSALPVWYFSTWPMMSRPE